MLRQRTWLWQYKGMVTGTTALKATAQVIGSMGQTKRLAKISGTCCIRSDSEETAYCSSAKRWALNQRQVPMQPPPVTHIVLVPMPASDPWQVTYNERARPPVSSNVRMQHRCLFRVLSQSHLNWYRKDNEAEFQL